MSKFKDLPILLKIRIVILLLALAFCIVIIFIFSFYCWIELKVSIPEEARELTDRVAVPLDRALSDITQSFVFTLGTNEFIEDLKSIQEGLSYMELNSRLQNEFTAIQMGNYLVDSVFLIAPDKETVYLLWSQSLENDEIFTEDEFSSITGITYLEERESPVRWIGSIIPLIWPLRYNGFFVEIATSDEFSSYMVALISAEKLEMLLNTGQDKYYSFSLSQGSVTLTANKDNYITLNTITLPTTGLKLSCNVDVHSLIGEKLQQTFLLIIAILVVAVLMLSLSSHILQRYVINPVHKLEKYVLAIEGGDYNQPMPIDGADELGKLSKSISDMSQTIGAQIQEIAYEKSLKYEMEMRFLQEQLKPHFLYNTLECIQQEVKKGELSVSTEMIRELSLFLRTALSGGKDTITIEDEIKRNLSYVRIMNHRFSSGVKISYWVDLGLETVLIPKSLLQPLVENSIIHGFAEPISSPQINLVFKRCPEDKLLIGVSDNGLGFDAETLLSIMSSKQESFNHVGLRNIYKRLTAVYGQEGFNVTASSIPYYKSEINIKIPLSQ